MVCYSASCQNKLPCEEKCLKVFYNPVGRIPLLTQQQADRYLDPWVYLSFFSKQGCSVSLKVCYKEGSGWVRTKSKPTRDDKLSWEEEEELARQVSLLKRTTNRQQNKESTTNYVVEN
jgi:hypothetical protein